MANKKELEVEAKERKAEIESYVLEVGELKETIENLEKDLAAAKNNNNPGAETEQEETVKLYWPGVVDDAQGSGISRFGIPLFAEDGLYFANVPKSRAEVELGRKGIKFTKTKPELKEE